MGVAAAACGLVLTGLLWWCYGVGRRSGRVPVPEGIVMADLTGAFRTVADDSVDQLVARLAVDCRDGATVVEWQVWAPAGCYGFSPVRGGVCAVEELGDRVADFEGGAL